jgi:pimeloyl-ACP methyl ester carboxylesterase
VPTSPVTYRVAGWLCQPRHPTDPRTIQVLVHGFSHNHRYWFGLGYPRLDHVRAAGRAGYPTFLIDQVGAGISAHPDPALVTFPNLAFVLSQLVADLRAGRVGRSAPRFTHVVGVGHSMGAGQWLTEAGVYHDVDAVVLRDFLHATDPATVNALRAHNIVVANTGPRFADLLDGYLSMQPRSVFYDTALAVPASTTATAEPPTRWAGGVRANSPRPMGQP